MHVHLRVHRWVVWWFYIGVICGVVAVINILLRHLSRTQEDVVLVIGALHWLLGGVVCYAYDAVRIEGPSRQPKVKAKDKEPSKKREAPEWHPASDFLFPGNRKSLLPPKH